MALPDRSPAGSASLSLAHGWALVRGQALSATLVRDFVRPAVRALPSSMARRLGYCRIALPVEVAAGVASQWTFTGSRLEVSVSTLGTAGHDVVMELLLCLGQRLWERLPDEHRRIYFMLLAGEIGLGIEGEIDAAALELKRALLASRSEATRMKRLTRYGLASFAGTAAEYVHALWHEVTIRSGPDYLPASALRRRLDLLHTWFPPDRGYRLYPAASPLRRA